MRNRTVMFPVPEGRPRVTVVAAVRPNFMKVGPIVRALDGRAAVTLVHTGQHYDDRMSRTFFRDLGIREPDVNLGVGSGSHAAQTARVLESFAHHLESQPADIVVVVGDVNSTLAAALAAVKSHIPVAHVEAGLRSRDWLMPEEINRVLTDRISQWLFTTSADADDNLADEGADPNAVHLVGNTMIDTLLDNLDRARDIAATKLSELQLPDHFAMATLHRPSNVDDARSLGHLIEAIGHVDEALPVVFPVHPRTMGVMKTSGVHVPANFRLVEPMPYLQFIGLVDRAALIFTDSGGVQEETSVLGVPCLTLRENTERPITCELGTNRLVGTDPQAVVSAGREALRRGRQATAIPLWDGKAAERIADVLVDD